MIIAIDFSCAWMRARSLTISYATNRAAWSCIAGTKENFLFQWQQEENVIGEAARCIFTVLAADPWQIRTLRVEPVK